MPTSQHCSDARRRYERLSRASSMGRNGSNMKLNPQDLGKIAELTLEHYNRRAEEFWEGTRDHDVGQNIAALLQYIENKPRSTILDFGCGPGRDLKAFAELGHTAVGFWEAPRVSLSRRVPAVTAKYGSKIPNHTRPLPCRSRERRSDRQVRYFGNSGTPPYRPPRQLPAQVCKAEPYFRKLKSCAGSGIGSRPVRESSTTGQPDPNSWSPPHCLERRDRGDGILFEASARAIRT
jgi:hypothetical protein